MLLAREHAEYSLVVDDVISGKITEIGDEALGD